MLQQYIHTCIYCCKYISKSICIDWSYIKNLSNVKDKVKKLVKLSGNFTHVTADVVALYPSIPHEDGLETL